MRPLIYLVIFFLAFSCTQVKLRDKERQIQSKILRLISSQNKNYAKCALESNLADSMKGQRLKIDMKIMIGPDGDVNQFQVLNSSLNEKFIDCLFRVTDNIKFPKLKSNESIELTQPFVFNL